MTLKKLTRYKKQQILIKRYRCAICTQNHHKCIKIGNTQIAKNWEEAYKLHETNQQYLLDTYHDQSKVLEDEITTYNRLAKKKILKYNSKKELAKMKIKEVIYDTSEEPESSVDIKKDIVHIVSEDLLDSQDSKAVTAAKMSILTRLIKYFKG